jgi:hypothetical protein
MTNQKNSTRIGVVLLLVMSILAIAYTILVVGYPDFFIKRSCPGYTGQAWIDLAAASPGAAVYIRAMQRQVGGFGLVLTLGTLIVLFGAFKRGERWAWVYFLVAATGGWLVNIIYHIFSKSPLGLAMNLVGIGVVILALIITAKDLLGKKIT